MARRLLSTAKDSQIFIKHIDMQEEHKGPAFTMNVHTTELPLSAFCPTFLDCTVEYTTKPRPKDESTLDDGLQCTFLHATTLSYAQPAFLRDLSRPLSSVVWPPFAFRRPAFRRSSPSPFARRFI